MKSQLLTSLKSETTKSKAAQYFISALNAIGSFKNRPSEFVTSLMNEFENQWELSGGNDQQKRIIVGTFFEFVIGECLMRKGISPLYYQAVLRHARISKFDWLLFHQKNPVLISCKKSARERWKQTAWEARDLKQIYAGGKCYLITIEKTTNVSGKMEEAPNTIDDFIVATSNNFDNLLDELAKTTFSIAVPESPILVGELCQ